MRTCNNKVKNDGDKNDNHACGKPTFCSASAADSTLACSASLCHEYIAKMILLSCIIVSTMDERQLRWTRESVFSGRI
jgi:hypothetical protein